MPAQVAKETGVPRLYVQEIAENMVKPRLENVRQWIDGVSK